MTAISHAGLWSAIDRLALRAGLPVSSLAKAAGLDATSLNPSKRASAGETEGRQRWPSTESLSKILDFCGVSFADFAAMADGQAAGATRVPLIGMAQAGSNGYFDDAGFPVGQGWDEIEVPGAAEGSFALEVTGDSMRPVYRDRDRLIVRPTLDPRREDRIVARTHGGEVLVKEVVRVSARFLELKSLNPEFPDRKLDRRDVAWTARVDWVSQ